jgi:hypothetical protein
MKQVPPPPPPWSSLQTPLQDQYAYAYCFNRQRGRRERASQVFSTIRKFEEMSVTADAGQKRIKSRLRSEFIPRRPRQLSESQNPENQQQPQAGVCGFAQPTASSTLRPPLPPRSASLKLRYDQARQSVERFRIETSDSDHYDQTEVQQPPERSPRQHSVRLEREADSDSNPYIDSLYESPRPDPVRSERVAGSDSNPYDPYSQPREFHRQDSQASSHVYLFFRPFRRHDSLGSEMEGLYSEPTETSTSRHSETTNLIVHQDQPNNLDYWPWRARTNSLAFFTRYNSSWLERRSSSDYTPLQEHQLPPLPPEAEAADQHRHDIIQAQARHGQSGTESQTPFEYEVNSLNSFRGSSHDDPYSLGYENPVYEPEESELFDEPVYADLL